MSNKIVESTYNNVIDDVISNVKYDFEEMGIEEEVLKELEKIWVEKLKIKTEVNSNDNNNDSNILDHLINQQQKLQEQSSSSSINNNNDNKDDDLNINNNDDDDDKEIDKKDRDDDDLINSDLDDDEDDDQDFDQNGDILLCLYDKVQRVKNKWKMTLKDGVININDKDYLFSKCTGCIRQMIKILNLNKFELKLNNDKTLVANNQDLGFINFRFYKYNKLLLYGDKLCKFSLLSNTLTELPIKTPINSLDYSNDYIYYSNNYNIYKFNLKSSSSNLLYISNSGIINNISLSKNSTHLVSCSKSGSLILHSLNTASSYPLNYTPRQSLSCTSFSPHFNNILCTGSNSGSLFVHDTNHLQKLPILLFPNLHNTSILTLSFSHASKSLLSCISRDGRISVIDLDSKSVIRAINTSYSLSSIAFEGALVAAGTTCGNILVYNLRQWASDPQVIESNSNSHIVQLSFYKDDMNVNKNGNRIKSKDYASGSTSAREVHFAQDVSTSDSDNNNSIQSGSNSNLNNSANIPTTSILKNNTISHSRSHSTSSVLSLNRPPSPPPKDKDTNHDINSDITLPVYMPSKAGALRPKATFANVNNSNNNTLPTSSSIDSLPNLENQSSDNSSTTIRPRSSSLSRTQLSLAHSSDSHLAQANYLIPPPRRRRHSSRSERKPNLNFLSDVNNNNSNNNNNNNNNSNVNNAPVSFHNSSYLKRSNSSTSLKYHPQHSRNNSFTNGDNFKSHQENLKRLIESANTLSLSSEISKARDILEGDYKTMLEGYASDIRKLRNENALLRRENERLRLNSSLR